MGREGGGVEWGQVESVGPTWGPQETGVKYRFCVYVCIYLRSFYFSYSSFNYWNNKSEKIKYYKKNL